jgi:aspartyl-tRNA(Asn)/glutamyl-tRNA(Gln) amidotransferase subunit A
VVDSEVAFLGIRELERRISAREVSALEVTELALERAEAIGAQLRAFILVDRDGARRDAELADRAIAQGKPLGPLHGVPITIKDLMSTRGMATSGGSRATQLGFSARRDAPVVRRLRRAGAILIGKTNLNEFAYGVTGENAHFGDVINPWQPGRVSGGSSSGSAASLAAGIGYGSVGTDTRGSIRIPSAFCGTSGIKPTRGLVPTEDVFPLSWTLDHVGPMARSAEDLATLLAVMAGGRSLPQRLDAALGRALDGLKVGVCGFFFQDLSEDVERAVRGALDELFRAGAQRVDLELPELADSLRASAVIAGSEGLAVHDKRLRDGAEGYGAPVLSRLETGYAYTGVELAQAEAVRRTLLDVYKRAFRQVDCMVGPTLPGVAPAIGSTVMKLDAREEGIVNACVRLVAPQNMTGVPAASIPCGLSREGLPIGLQIWAAAGDDDVVLGVAHRYQTATDWHERHPERSGTGNPGRA